eukprot:852734-Pelagomonas_calceolata.AAC.2
MHQRAARKGSSQALSTLVVGTSLILRGRNPYTPCQHDGHVNIDNVKSISVQHGRAPTTPRLASVTGQDTAHLQ